MAKQVDFFDGAQSSTTPTIGNVDTTNLACYANDAAYEADNAGSPTEGNIYCNTTDNTIRYYNGTTWTELADSDSTQTFTNKTIDGTDATGTNTITNDATDVTYDNTTSSMTATTAQAAIDEVEARVDTVETDVTTAQGAADANTTDIADIRTTTGTADGDTDMGSFTGTTLTDNSDVKTLLQELETAVEAVGGALVFIGTWNADTNTPSLSSGSGTQGNFYIVSTAGSTNLDGITDWAVNDWAIFDGTVWRKIDNSELVTSVNGQTGTVTIGVNDLDGLAGTNGARRELRRDSGNTAWEIYNPHNNASDSASGANATLGGVGAKVVSLTNASLTSVGGVGAGYANQTFILTNKTGVPVTINNEDAVATAADRILTGTSGPIDLDVDAAIPLVYDTGSSRWRLAAGTGSGGGGLTGAITSNNSTADSTTGDWTVYEDTGDGSPDDSFPDDGTGGSPNITVTRTTVSNDILQGKGSFQITKGAFDRQGEGASLDVEVDRYLRGQTARIAFSYEASANFDFGNAATPVANPSDISVFLYDVTNSNILTPSETGVFGDGSFEATVAIPASCEDIRVILHIATTNALAWDFRFDRVQLELISELADGLNALAIMRAYKNGGAMASSTDIGTWTLVEKDSVSGFNSTTGVYTVQKPGDYEVFANYTLTAAGGAFMRIKKNGTSVQVGGTDNSDSFGAVSTILTDLQYGDTISIEMSAAVTASSQNDGTSFSIIQKSDTSSRYIPKITYIKDVKPNNTAGGTLSSGAWFTRDLNTLSGDTTSVSLNTNQFTLQPGTYHIEAAAPAYAVNSHNIKLRNITTANDDITGMGVYSNSLGNGGQVPATLTGTITISAAEVFEIQHRCLSTFGTNGRGIAMNFGIDETYTTVKITKVL